jgi:hypothetical protein
MGRIRNHLTFANVVSMIALFVALGGGAYALSRGEVKSRHIATDAVKARHHRLRRAQPGDAGEFHRTGTGGRQR